MKLSGVEKGGEAAAHVTELSAVTVGTRTVVTAVVAAITGAVAYWLVPKPLPELSRAEFMEEVHAGHVHKIEIEDLDVILSESTTRGPFRTAFDQTRDAGLPNELRSSGIEIWYSQSPPTP